jgi:hypothetical protein
MKRTNKLSIPKLIVGSNLTALVNNTALVGATNALAIANGQLAALSWDYTSTTPLGTTLAPGVTATACSAIKVIQGTPGSANLTTADNVFRVSDPSLIESGIIERSRVISFAARKARIATNGAVLASITSSYVPLPNTQYGFYTELISQTNDRDNSDNDNVLSTVLVTPDWGGTATAPTSKIDWVTQNLAANLNSRSRIIRSSYGTGAEDVVVFGLKLAGGSATGLAGRVVSTTLLGDVINVQTVNGLTSTFTVDQPFVQMLAQMRTSAGGTAFPYTTATWETIDLTTAGNAAKIDAIIVMALPRVKSRYFDNIEQQYPIVKVNPGMGFASADLSANTYMPTYSVQADDGYGQGQKIRNESDKRNQLFMHTMQTQPHGEWFSAGPEYIDETAYYHTFTIEYFDTENTINAEVITPKQVTIIVPAPITLPSSTVVTIFGNSPSGYFGLAVAGEPITSLESTIGAWLKSCASAGFSSIALQGSATASVYFSA